MSEETLLSVPAEIKKAETMSDRGLKLVIYTQELNSADSAALFKLKGNSGFFLFKSTKISESDVATIPNEIKEFKTDRTPSERLRAVIYRVWEQTAQKESFQQFYGRHIDQICEQYKEQLN